jgi:hypothetical protein
VVVPLQSYSQERKVELLLSNVVDGEDYTHSEEEVRTMGLDTATIAHRGP